jgi:mannosylglycoprotein endo-beta-mannosidase
MGYCVTTVWITRNKELYRLHKAKEKGVVLKLDYEKAYDRVSWDFMFEVLESRGFSSRWVQWIRQLVTGVL